MIQQSMNANQPWKSTRNKAALRQNEGLELGPGKTREGQGHSAPVGSRLAHRIVVRIS